MSVGLENEESMDLGNLILTYLRNAIFGFILGTQIHILLDLQDLFGSNSFRAKLEVIQLRKSEAMWGEKIIAFLQPPVKALGITARF